MNKGLRILLILVAVVCLGIAVSYPIQFWMHNQSNERTMEQLAQLRQAGLQRAAEATTQPEEPVSDPGQQGSTVTTDETLYADAEDVPGNGASSLPQNGNGDPNSSVQVNPVPDGDGSADEDSQSNGPEKDIAVDSQVFMGGDPEAILAISPTPQQGEGDMGTPDPEVNSTPSPTPPPTPSPTPSPTPDRSIHSGPLPYSMKEKVTLEESRILPQYRELYELNHDFVGWITIQKSVIDYPVLQNMVNDYYLTHDFFGEYNKNGQIILDKLCDPYTPSYNLILSGHNMHTEAMFSTLTTLFRRKDDWKQHKFIQFDTLMEERTYVVFAAFFAADYDVDEEGFRYNADLQYRIDVDKWLEEVRDYQLYNTGIDVEFGDEFLTLTTCNRWFHDNGRFVVVARRIRDGETFE